VHVAAGAADGASLAALSFTLKEELPLGIALPIAAPAQLPSRGVVDVEAID
jgi:hypothetical protein